MDKTKVSLGYPRAHICVFNQLRIKPIQKKSRFIIPHMYYIVKPTMDMSVPNMYRLFFLSLFPKQ